MRAEELSLDQLDYADGDSERGERRAVTFRVSFLVPYPKEG
jgi:hypothetical protein